MEEFVALFKDTWQFPAVILGIAFIVFIAKTIYEKKNNKKEKSS